MNIINKIFIILSMSLFSIFSYGEESIKWACGDYPYAYYLNEEGETTGFLYDIALEAIEKRMGIKIDLKFMSWKRCQILVESGEFDMMLTIPTKERLKYASTTNTPAWIKVRNVYTYKNHPRLDVINNIKDLEDIKIENFSVISYIGNGWIKESVEGLGINVYYSPVIENMYQMLINKRGDVILEESSLVEATLVKNPEFAKDIVKTNGIGSSSAFHIMIGKKSKYIEVLDELNNTLLDMWEDGSIDNILSRYGL